MADQRKLPTQATEPESLSGALFENLMAQSTDAIVITDSAERISHWSMAANTLFGYAADEVMGKSLDLILPLSTITELRNGTTMRDPMACKSANGSPLLLTVTFSEAIDSEKNLVALTFIFRDVSASVRKDELIKQKIHALESFSYSVSHDLRAPLRRIINYAEILNEDHLDSLSEEVQRIVSRMSKNAQKMTEMIDALLAFSRVGQHALQISKINMESLAKSVIAEMKNTKQGTKATFHLGTLEPSQGDLVLIKQVLEQLLSNAIKFSAVKDNPVIEIGCIPEKNESTYFIRDNGVGYDMQYSQKLFNVFQRLHNPNEFEGSGIGLAIVQQIITRHGGTVAAEGKIDQGATFYFSLPK